TLHWVSANHAVDAEVRLYAHLLTKSDPTELEEGQGFTDLINPSSLEVLEGCKMEPGLTRVPPGHRFQLERLGYFCADPDSSAAAPVFNRTVTLKDTWARIQKARKT
ncbi:glutamine--tRNA ligase, partial [Fibrobacterota bacterium]